MNALKKYQRNKDWLAICQAAKTWQNEHSKSSNKRGLRAIYQQLMALYIVKWDYPRKCGISNRVTIDR